MTTYKDSGVDIDAADNAVENIKDLVKNTFNKNVLSNLGSFGACYKFPKNDYNNPILVSSADGVGTKLKIANLFHLKRQFHLIVFCLYRLFLLHH